jgi:hypothetical protein
MKAVDVTAVISPGRQTRKISLSEATWVAQPVGQLL